MKINYYVCSSIHNRDLVRETYKRLNALGYNLMLDWTQDSPGMSIPERVQKAKEEAQAIMESNVVIVLLPTRFGSQTELGMAIASSMFENKRIFVWAEKDEDLYYMDGFDKGWYKNIFYYMPQVKVLKCPYDRLIEILEEEIHYFKNEISECRRP